MPTNTTIYKTKNLTIRYLIAVSLLAVLSISAYTLIQIILYRQASDASVINLAGRQRMLSQKLTKEVLLLAQSSSLQMREHQRQELTATVAIWLRVHNGLQYGDQDLQLPGENSPEVHDLFTKIEPYYQIIKSAADKIIALESSDLSLLSPNSPLVQDIVKTSPVFLECMDSIVFEYDKEARIRIDLLKRYEIYILSTVLLLLGLETLLIFRPMVNRVRRNYRDFQQAYEQLQQEIAERKRAQAKLHKAKKAAETANLAKSDFLANMSHEIRTPLNAIIGMTELTLETELNAEQRGFLNVVQSSSEGLLCLINDILDFSKIEAGQMELENIDFNLRKVVEGAAEIFEVHAEAKGTELLCYIEPDLPSWVVGDPTRLRQVLVNLTGNAIKFTEKGEVAVKVVISKPGAGHADQEKKVELHFLVSDTGIGITQKNIQKIFKKFSQADSSTTRKFGGTGLGLAISKSLVDLMGGEMWIESKEGQGSTFHFKLHLPIGNAKTKKPTYACLRACTHKQACPNFKDLIVLVVDDNETNRFILRKTLTAWGFQVKEAQSGPQALAILRECKDHIQLIILDQQMPEMDGLELAQKIREKPIWADIKMIMLSSVGSVDFQLKKKLDIARYITKPAKQSKLFGILMQTLCYQNLDSTQRVKVVTEKEANARIIQHRILLAEDNLTNQRLAKKILQKAGYGVDLAENGQLAVEAARRFHHDLILMDIQMPVMDGFAATQEIRRWQREHQEEPVSIVALTAHAMQGYREKCLKYDMNDYITKPIKKKVLLETIRKWLDLRPTILVVDDSIDNRDLIKNYLKKEDGCKLVFAGNGQEAVDIYQSRTVSLILMDMEMPVMDGYTAAAAIRALENGMEVPIVALTAHQGRSEVKKCLDAGCTGYLCKPVRKQGVLEVLHQYLSKPGISVEVGTRKNSQKTKKVAEAKNV